MEIGAQHLDTLTAGVLLVIVLGMAEFVKLFAKRFFNKVIEPSQRILLDAETCAMNRESLRNNLETHQELVAISTKEIKDELTAIREVLLILAMKSGVEPEKLKGLL